jgi:hypothetical protein
MTLRMHVQRPGRSTTQTCTGSEKRSCKDRSDVESVKQTRDPNRKYTQAQAECLHKRVRARMCTCTAHAARGCIGISLVLATACREQLHPCDVRKSGQCTCKVQAESHCGASRYMCVCTAVGVSLTKGYASCAMHPVQSQGLHGVTWFPGERFYVCLFVCVPSLLALECVFV